MSLFAAEEEKKQARPNPLSNPFRQINNRAREEEKKEQPNLRAQRQIVRVSKTSSKLSIYNESKDEMPVADAEQEEFYIKQDQLKCIICHNYVKNMPVICPHCSALFGK